MVYQLYIDKKLKINEYVTGLALLLPLSQLPLQILLVGSARFEY